LVLLLWSSAFSGVLFATFVEPLDTLRLPDGGVATVRKVLKTKVPRQKDADGNWSSRSQTLVELSIDGADGMFIGTVMLGYDPKKPSDISRVVRTGQAINHIEALMTANPSLNFQPTRFAYSLDFKGEKAHLVYSPDAALPLSELLFLIKNKENARVDWRMRLLLARELLSQLGPTLETLWNSGRVHFDIKPQNIVVSSEGGFKLIDFEGVSKIGSVYNGDVPITTGYKAPDFKAKQNSKYLFSASYDAYALGLVLQDVLFPDAASYINANSNLLRGIGRSSKGDTINIEAAREVLALIDRLKHKDPQKRLVQQGSSLGSRAVAIGPIPMLDTLAAKYGFYKPQNMKTWAASMQLDVCYGSKPHLQPKNRGEKL
jgi:serine/threonine protein kinase